MANPPNATIFPGPMDPADIVDYQYELTQGTTGGETLQPGEGVASYTLTATAEAAAAGLTIRTTGGYATSLSGLLLRFWLSISAGMQADAMFAGGGVAVAIELTITTNSTPARVKQRTLVITVANQ